MHIRKAACAALLLVSTASVSAQVGGIFDKLDKLGVGKQGKLTDDKIVSGLKEALQVGTDNAVKSTGRPDGFFKNEVIKILMPEKMRSLAKGLRMIGYGPKIDEFELSMNRAAEKAAPAAKKIFVDAILAMTFEDARKLLSGGETAATDYFKAKTSDQLATAFRPIVEKATAEVGVTEKYKELTGGAKGIPFAKVEAIDLDHYVVIKALDGLFYVLGQEERKIRTNPAARITDLLKLVFGK